MTTSRQHPSIATNVLKSIFYSPLVRKLYCKLEATVNRVRCRALTAKLKTFGTNVNVQLPVTITAPNEVAVGSNVSIAAYVHIWGEGGVAIGNRVMIGAHTSISSITHDYTQLSMFDTIIVRPVVIEDDVWIGSNCVILPGLTVGTGAVVGAGAVVTKDVAPNTIVVGNPAKPTKVRPVNAPDQYRRIERAS